jgi:hypothetical protein
MRNRLTRTFGLLILLSTLAVGQTSAPASLRDFVQGFYDWYTPIALKDHSGPAWEIALRQRSSAFAPALRQALQQDLQIQAHAEGEIVGIDFDPFLASQDPCEQYKAGESIVKGNSYWVKIYAICNGTRRQSPAVVAEVIRDGNAWRFINFHDPLGGDLLTTLKKLKTSR